MSSIGAREPCVGLSMFSIFHPAFDIADCSKDGCVSIDPSKVSPKSIASKHQEDTLPGIDLHYKHQKRHHSETHTTLLLGGCAEEDEKKRSFLSVPAVRNCWSSGDQHQEQLQEVRRPKAQYPVNFKTQAVDAVWERSGWTTRRPRASSELFGSTSGGSGPSYTYNAGRIHSSSNQITRSSSSGSVDLRKMVLKRTSSDRVVNYHTSAAVSTVSAEFGRISLGPTTTSTTTSTIPAFHFPSSYLNRQALLPPPPPPSVFTPIMAINKHLASAVCTSTVCATAVAAGCGEVAEEEEDEQELVESFQLGAAFRPDDMTVAAAAVLCSSNFPCPALPPIHNLACGHASASADPANDHHSRVNSARISASPEEEWLEDSDNCMFSIDV